MSMTKPFRILVCGGQDWENRVLTFGVLDGYKHFYGEKGIPIVIVQGGARGADFLAKEWAIKNDVPQEEYLAEWSKYGRRAGPMRNSKMLATEPDLVIAFPGGRGTADTMGKARKMNIPVVTPARPDLYANATD